MKFFEDKKMTKPIKSIYFGKVKAGESKELTIYVFNDSKAVLTNLLFEFPGLPEGEILEVDAPITIQSKTAQPLKLRWKPSRNFKRALEVEIEIRGEEVYMAKRQFSIVEPGVHK